LRFYEKTPENGTCPPLDMATDPVKDSPANEAVAIPAQVPTPVMVRVTEATPAVTVVAVMPGAQVVPPQVRVMLFAIEFDVPVFSTAIVPVGPAASVPWTRLVLIVETLAVLVNDPNRPKTNPAIAMAAMRVMAMRMTVASTGEMAFLFFL